MTTKYLFCNTYQMVFSNFFKNLGNGIKFSNLTVCCLKRLDNAFDSCYKQGKKRQFSLWGIGEDGNFFRGGAGPQFSSRRGRDFST